MPRDKTATNARIIRYMTEEFLEYGYEKASLNRISARVGITTAGLYKHFESKEDMFYSLVKDTLEDFGRLTGRAEEQMLFLLFAIQDAVPWHVVPPVMIAVLAEVIRAAFHYSWSGDVVAAAVMTFSSFGYYGQIWFNRAYTYECAV